MRETERMRRMMVAASDVGARLMRNTVGQAWLGKVTAISDTRVMIERPKRVKFGLGVGSSDLVGWRTITITPEMVGKRIAQFTACEVKVPGKKASAEQNAFLMAVAKAGGLAMVHSETEALVHDLTTGV